MILGNKSDMEDKRVVSTERGEAVKYQQFKLLRRLQKYYILIN